MCCFCIHVGFSIVSHIVHEMCTLYIMLSSVEVGALLLLNMRGTSEPFYIVLWVSFQIECDPSIIIGSMLCSFFHPLSVFV